MVSYINTFIFIFFRTFSTPGFFPRMIPSFIVGSWFCSTGVDAATLEWSPGACPKKRIPGSTRNHTFSFQNPGFWMVQNSQSQQCRGLWNHAENRQLSKSTQKRKHWNWRIKIHSLPMKHPFSNQPAWLRNWEKNGHVFSRRAPPPTWLGRSVRRFGGRRPGWEGTKRTNATRGQFEKGSGPPPNATGLSNTADPLKSWSHQDAEDISRGEKSAFSLGEKSGSQTGTEHQNSTQKTHEMVLHNKSRQRNVR